MNRAAVVALAVLAAAACGSWRRVGTEDAPRSDVTLPQLFDAGTIYRQMGFLVAGTPLPWVASARYLAGPSPDSTLALVSVSLTNQALAFHRDAAEFIASYHIEVAFRREGEPGRQIARDETVRVRSFQETLRADESVIFQQFLAVPPGSYTLSVGIRDRNAPNFSRQERVETVPRFGGPGIASPIPFYEGSGRYTLTQLPALVVNPKATLPYGGDSLRIYVETYGVAAGSAVVARALDGAGEARWADTATLRPDGGFAGVTFAVAAAALPVGRAELEVGVPGAPGAPLRATAPLLVSFSHQWVITNFDDIISLLRYFERQDLLRDLEAAALDERPAKWREFWRETDPVPLTPDNEALDEYFRRVQTANVRYRGEGDAGWLTDRGEVYITLGDPDDVLDLSHELNRGGGRIIRWTYTTHRLVLYFQDQTGFGRFRLTPLSRAEYQRVLARVRRSQ